MTDRFSSHQVATWRHDGCVVIPDFFTSDEVLAVAKDFETVTGRSEGGEQPMNKKKAGEIGRFNPAQFSTFEAVPFECSKALNLIGVHPALIAFARAALGTDDVHLYQCQLWAKYTGDADYDQPFHCDFSNHTLTVPSEDAVRNSVTVLGYFSDVSEAHGPMHYVTRTDGSEIAGPEASLNSGPELQLQLQTCERSSAGRAGTLFAYGIDIYHRGTNLTAPKGHRYAVSACYKNAQDPTIGYHAWPYHHLKPWHRIFEHATPDQLTCFGVRPPGHPFWTEATLRGAQTRYPGWDLTPYREAL